MEFLKNCQDQYSFGRVMPFILFLIGCIIAVCSLIYGNIDTIYELALATSPIISGLIIYIFEILREIKNLHIKIGDKVEISREIKES